MMVSPEMRAEIVALPDAVHDDTASAAGDEAMDTVRWDGSLVVVVVAGEHRLHTVTLENGEQHFLQFETVSPAIVIRILVAMAAGAEDGTVHEN